jgi:hypothetical protein
MKFETPAIVQNLLVSNINTNTTYFNPDGSTMSCLTIETKPDEVIKIDGAIFDNVVADNAPPMVNIIAGNIIVLTDMAVYQCLNICFIGTLTGTAVVGYNVILKNFTIDSQTFTNSAIKIDSATGQIQIDELNFLNNVASSSYPAIEFVSLVRVSIDNSVFTNNRGILGNDVYLSSYSSGPITFSK